MSINVWDVGDLVRVSGLFYNINGDLADPSTVTLYVMDPDGTIITYEYLGSPEEVTRDGVGSYYVDVNATAVGDWNYEWKSTDVAQAAEPGQFVVQPRMIQP